MKVVITLTDGPDGIFMNATAQHNGCNDGAERSLAYLTAINIQRRIQAMSKTGILVLSDEDNITH